MGEAGANALAGGALGATFVAAFGAGLVAGGFAGCLMGFGWDGRFLGAAGALWTDGVIWIGACATAALTGRVAARAAAVPNPSSRALVIAPVPRP